MFNSGFGQQSGSSFGGFGQQQNQTGSSAPSLFGQPAQPAAASPFGQPQQNSAPAPLFGQQPSSTPAFGQPSASPFGQPSASPFGGSLGQPGGLGQPAGALGQPAPSLGQPGLGQPATSPFGNTLGQPALGAPQGQAAGQTQGTTVPFTVTEDQDITKNNGNRTDRYQTITHMREYDGRVLQDLRLQDYQAGRKGPSAAPAFGAFGQPAGLNTGTGAQSNASPFGQPSAGGAFGASSSPFGQPAAPAQPSLFGNSFGAKPSGFGNTATGFGSANTSNSGSMFGQPQQPAAS